MFVSNYRRAAAVSGFLVSLVLLAQIWSGSFIPFRPYFDDIQALSQNSNPDTEGTTAATDAQPSPAEKLGYVTWLGKTGDGSDKEDIYFIATRILVYQILHDPSTRSPRGLPIIVMTTPDVTAENRKRLEDDGATVVPIEFITEGLDWLKPRRPTWAHIMSKLRAWELTDYSRLLMLDGDMLLRRPIDNVFDELNATVIDSRSIPEKEVKHDENPIPAKYLLAGGPEVRGTLHHFPPSRENGDFIHPTGCNLGFVMLAPSREMFEYYMSILKIEGRFNSATMEQSLLNYAHRPEGAMPWQDLPFTYNTRTPIEEDIVGNVASIHEKWWTDSKNYPPLRKWYRSKKEEMEKFYIALDAVNT